MPELYYHIAEASVFRLSKNGVYAPAAFEADGFIHMCFAEQLAGVHQRYYKGQSGLLLLCISLQEDDFSGKKLILEDLTGSGENFPHYYAPLPLSKIKGHHPLEAEDDDPLKMQQYLMSVVKLISDS